MSGIYIDENWVVHEIEEGNSKSNILEEEKTPTNTTSETDHSKDPQQHTLLEYFEKMKLSKYYFSSITKYVIICKHSKKDL